jgi:tRNA/tmRNA/rRNA uracil-C5-methylase (TrmA/RlmC/RlmD family)
MQGSHSDADAARPLPRAGDVVELRIDALAAGGDGVGRAPDGRVIFVPLTAPGDRVRARLETVHPRHARAELERVLEPGPARVTPPCHVFGECGGCSWQHVDYAVQCDAKRAIVEDALRRVGRLALPAPVMLRPSPTPYAYRARARVMVAAGEVGYRRRRSHTLCAVRRCPVLTASAEAQLHALADALPPRDGEWELASGARGARAHAVGSPGPAIELDVGAAPLRISAGVFFQANPALHAALIASVARAAGTGSLALELYAGAGFFTLDLARAFERVIAVEADPAAVGDLRHNLARARCSGVEVVHERAEVVLAGERLRGIRPDVVVLDPPRTGLARGAADHLCAQAPARIVYLSCDPATLARDLAALVAGGFALEAVEAFDLFPHTPHVEVLASLRSE